MSFIGTIIPLMSATIDNVFQEALQLSEESRMSLIERLIVSTNSYSEIEGEQIKIAESRREELRSGEVKGVAVEDAIQRARHYLS